MCGIVGLVMKGDSGLWQKQQNCFQQMLYVDAIRGEDATGLIGVEKDGTFHTMKEAVEANWFLAQWMGSDIQKDMYSRGKAYIGHNRKKTVGKISDETSHPFVVDNNFAMVHNGTLTGHKDLADTEVDSQALAIHLCRAFREQNRLEALNSALGKVKGAYAVAGYDQVSNQVFLLRNHERPLGIIETDDAWYFGSETMMIEWILARNGYGNKDRKYIPLNDNELVTFRLNQKTSYEMEVVNPKKSWGWKAPKHNTITPLGGTGFMTSPVAKATGGTNPDYIKVENLKAFKDRWMGRRCVFVADDLIEEDYPVTLEKGCKDIMLFGSNAADIPFVHTLCVQVDLDKIEGVEKKLDDILSRRWSCTIEKIERANDGSLILTGYLPKVINPPLTGKEVDSAMAYRSSIRKMLKKDIHAELYKVNEEKIKSEKWKVGALQAELLFRQQFNNVATAKEKAFAAGQLLTSYVRDGSFIYTDKEGNIYYESALVLAHG